MEGEVGIVYVLSISESTRLSLVASISRGCGVGLGWWGWGWRWRRGL